MAVAGWLPGTGVPAVLNARVALTNAEPNRAVTIYRYGVRYVELERAAALREIES